MAGSLPVKVAVLGSSVSSIASELAGAEIAEVLVAEDSALNLYTPDAYAMAVRAVVEVAKPTFVLMPHTYQARDCAPMIGARLRKALITDVTGISGTGVDATFTRPMFQGKLAAQVKPLGEPPFFITLQIGAFRADTVRKGGSAPVSPVSLHVDTAQVRQTPEAPF